MRLDFFIALNGMIFFKDTHKLFSDEYFNRTLNLVKIYKLHRIIFRLNLITTTNCNCLLIMLKLILVQIKKLTVL
jgi:hypothetical protein